VQVGLLREAMNTRFLLYFLALTAQSQSLDFPYDRALPAHALRELSVTSNVVEVRMMPHLAPNAPRVIVVEPPPMPLEIVGLRAAMQVGPNGPTNALLAWNPSDHPSIAVYRVYRGTASRTYDSNFETPGTNASFLLVQGQTNYFATTAISMAGLESDFSNEVLVRAVPSPPPTTSFALVIQSSTNMINWGATVPDIILTNRVPTEVFRLLIKKVVP
jgi:hypothetical protein